MGRLFPVPDSEVCFGTAEFTIDPTGPTPRLELWERQVPFDLVPPLQPLPPFKKTGIFSSTTTLTRSVPKGTLFQARLFRELDGPNGPLIGKVDIPSLLESNRANFLTSCAEGHVPQLQITPGGTFVSTAIASSVPTKARVQLSTNIPNLDGGIPFFDPEEKVASTVSDTAQIQHNLTLLDELTEPEIIGHTPLLSGQGLFFVILAWDSLGHFDYVWSSKGPAPATQPESISTKQRVVSARLSQLFCFDDSDDASDGEASFRFIVAGDTGAAFKTIKWEPMESGSRRAVSGGESDVTLNPPDTAGKVTVRVEGVEDDSGSLFPDSNDTATAGEDSGTPLPLPVGPADEQFTDRLLTLDSHPTSNGELLSFSADVVFSVTYI
ncbi:hypothetical protein [Streptomyces sp. BK340]|uniref:hypothetical protein n=1 Tax=Streptomyces sp. BK340 TaxID=2572903 RepID=UPI00119F85F2|nr:hypothetical protein [Streptomyces sp. BK340]TVZ76876.1 hypothetical protein FB157_14114 [Streptomyces sp. BK340]